MHIYTMKNRGLISISYAKNKTLTLPICRRGRIVAKSETTMHPKS
jgi:hypothetical protein